MKTFTQTSLTKRMMAILLSLLFAVSSFTIAGIVPTMDAQAATAVYNPDSNLQLRWFVNNTTTDVSGKSRNITDESGVSWTEDYSYPAAKFNNGRSKYQTGNNLLSDGIASSIESGGAGTTIAFMAYFSDNTSSAPFFTIYHSDYSSNNKRMTQFSLSPNGNVTYANNSGNDHNTAGSTTKLQASANQWHTYIIKMMSAKKMVIWLDGVKTYEETSDFYDNHTFDYTNTIKIGANRATNSYFNGYIRDFRIYKRDLDGKTIHDNLLAIANESSVKAETLNNTISKSNYGVIRGGNTTRFSGDEMTIVNDQEADNTSAGIIKYDISDLINGYKVTEATLNAKISSYNTEPLPTSFYYTLNSTIGNQYAKGTSEKVSLSAGTGTTGRDSCLSILGSDSTKFIGTIAASNTSVNQLDLKNALNDAISNGSSYIYIIIVKSSAGSNGAGSGGGWSDTIVKASEQTISYKASLITQTRDDVVSQLSNSNRVVDNWTKARPSTTVKINGVNAEASNNVVYSQNGTGWSITDQQFSSPNQIGWGVHWASYKISYYVPTTTFVYDNDTTEMYTSVMMGIIRKNSDANRVYVNMVYPTTTYLSLKETWKGYKDNFNYPSTYAVNPAWEVGYASNKRYGTNNFDNDTYRAFKNKLYVNIVPTSTLTTFSSTSWQSYSDCEPVSNIGGDPAKDSGRRAGGSNTINNPINIIDVRTIESIADGLNKGTNSAYNVLRNNPSFFTYNTGYNFAKAVYELCSFKLTNYSLGTTDGCVNAANKIDELVENYNIALSQLQIATYTASVKGATGGDFTYVQAAGTKNGNTYTQSKWNYSETLGKAGSIDPIPNPLNTTQHIVYSWGADYTADTMPIVDGDITFNRTGNPEDCSFTVDGDIISESTCNVAGSKYVYCSVCNRQSTASLPLAEHSLGAWQPNVSSTYCYALCSVCNDWITQEHNFVKVTGTAATCTTDGLSDGVACSECGHIKTAQTTIPASGHSYSNTGTEVTVDGETTINYNCANCTDVYKVNITVYKANLVDANNALATDHMYTDASLDDLRDAVTDNALDYSNHRYTQGEIDAMARAILTAYNSLAPLKFTVTFTYEAPGEDPVVEEITDIAYGQQIELTVPVAAGSVYKWTRTIDNNDTGLAENTNTIKVIVTSNASFNAYIADTTERVDQHVVAIYTKGGKITDVLYVNDGDSISINNTNGAVTYNGRTVTPIKTPCYKITGYRVGNTDIGTEYTVTHDVNLAPVYSPINAITVAIDNAQNAGNAKFANDTYSYEPNWDEKITINADKEVVWYVNGVPVAQGETYTFRATSSITITTEVVSEIQSGSIITFAGYESSTRKVRVAASTFTNSSRVIKEQGIFVATSNDAGKTFTADEVKAGRNFAATNTTDTLDQFSFTLNVSTTSTVKKFGILSYVIYEGDDTVYYSATPTNVTVE